MSSLAERQAVYGTRKWRSLRALTLKKAGYLCQCAECRAHGLTKAAELVHHVTAWQHVAEHERMQWAFDPENLMAVSRDCHARLHAKHDESAKDVHERGWDRLVKQTM